MAMDEATIHRAVLWVFLAVALVTFPALFLVTAPYGRHGKGTWGPTISSRTGWLLMESPSAIVFFALFLLGDRRDPASIAFLLLWELHYFHRAFVFPFRMRGAEKPMPVLIAAFAFTFTALNGYLNGRWLYAFGPARDVSWLWDPRFLVGAAVFLAGFVINQHADWVLIHLRKPGETGYKIPHGGLYRWVSCPNYLGEMLEWTGFALATFSLPALVFALWTIANLLPRARSNHRWYKETFPDYPPGRRALIPGLF